MKPTIIIKTGGKVAVISDELKSLIREIKELSNSYNFALVHGGGAEVTQMSRIYGLEAQFIDGIRMTTSQEMEIVDSVLAGKVNKRVVREFQSLGVNAVGLSGNDGAIFTGVSIDNKGENRTGKVTIINSDLLNLLLESGYTPIINSVSMEKSGEPLNINADDAALAISSALEAQMVIFISDIPGVLKDREIIKKLSPEIIKNEIESGVISGGMIPKVNNSVDALKNGTHSVVISNYEESGDLNRLIKKSKGSIITLGEEEQ